MNVPSLAFFAFAAVAALAINLSQHPIWRRAVLLVANLGFVLTFTRDPLQLAPFAAFLAAGYGAMVLMRRRLGGAAFALVIVAFVAMFVWLKHYTFVPHAAFLPFAYLTVGLSYVFFRVVSLIIDAHQDTLPAAVDPISYLNYTLNFTSFVSGPIQWYRDYRTNEAERPSVLTRAVAAASLERIILGAFKVTILSPLLAFVQAQLIAAVAIGPTLDRAAAAGAATLVFAIYLYVNFSGYMDVVIGTARFLRLTLPENFKQPFAASGFIDFWSRWHITLSLWMRTYVFGPLLKMLMRRFPAPKAEPMLGVVAFFVTFFLIGVWHGQTTEFLFYGVLQGAGVSGNKLYQMFMTERLGRSGYRSLTKRPAYAALSRGLTISYFAATLLWFWSSWHGIGSALAELGIAGTVSAAVILIAGTSLVLMVWDAIGASAARIGSRTELRAGGTLRIAAATALFALVATSAVLQAPAPHIVYRGF